jgi:hypothetical protein
VLCSRSTTTRCWAQRVSYWQQTFPFWIYFNSNQLEKIFRIHYDVHHQKFVLLLRHANLFLGLRDR